MSNIINLKETRKNVENALTYINEGEKRSNQIRFQHIHTLSKIIYLQACRLSHYAGLRLLQEGSNLTAEDIACNKPKAYLAKSCQVTSRTIQNHIKRLEEKEIIKRINKDGKLLLIVNPMLLSISPNFEHIRAVLWNSFANCNLNNNSELDFSRAKTFPINNPSGNINSIITTSVEKLKLLPSCNNKTDEICQETQKTKQVKNQGQEKSEVSTLKHNRSEKNRIQKPGAAENFAFQQKQFVQRQVMILWLWCVEHLYSDRSFIAESQEEYAIEYFTKSFEGKHGAEVYNHISTLRAPTWKVETLCFKRYYH